MSPFFWCARRACRKNSRANLCRASRSSEPGVSPALVWSRQALPFQTPVVWCARRACRKNSRANLCRASRSSEPGVSPVRAWSGWPLSFHCPGHFGARRAPQRLLHSLNRGGQNRGCGTFQATLRIRVLNRLERSLRYTYNSRAEQRGLPLRCHIWPQFRGFRVAFLYP